MGTYYLVVNPARRQYLDPGRFGEGVKYHSALNGGHCLLALKLLICDRYQREEGSFRGAWLGDPVILAGDDEGRPDPGGLITSTPDNPHRNLNALAHAEFTNISYRALAELCLHHQTAMALAEQAAEDESLLIDLGATLEQYRPPVLELALEQVVGHPWRKAYQQVRTKHPWWLPLPPIDWPV